jgi:hypothetical protein
MKFSSLVLGALALFLVPAFAEEEGPDIRGVWVADVSPDNTLLVTDCACEDSSSSIELTCKPKSGEVHVELHDFLDKGPKVGDDAKVSFVIDGKATEKNAKFANFDGEEKLPIFDMPVDDPLIESLAHGKSLKLVFGKKTAATKMKGSRGAFTKLQSFCAK